MLALGLCLLLWAFMPGCGAKPDPDKECQMFLDQTFYSWEPGVAFGSAYGREVGSIQDIQEFEVVFPNFTGAVRRLPGLSIRAKIAAIRTGQELSFGSGNSGCEVSFRPPYRPTTKEGIVMGYSSYEDSGLVRIRFDGLEPRYAGKVSGMLLYARLNAFYYDTETGDVKKAQKPAFLEIYNWPFDVMLGK